LLLDAGADMEKVSEGSTALLYAIETRRIQTVKLLLDRDTNVNQPAKRGLRRTPLQRACETGDFEIIKLLLGKGAAVNAPPANGGATALQLAAINGSQRIFRLLLDEKADIHGPKATFNGRTTLEAAAEHGRLSLLDTILTEGASGFGADEIESAKALAEDEGHQGCVERLRLTLYRLHNQNGTLPPLRL
jgi:ankyrin repeat protein